MRIKHFIATAVIGASCLLSACDSQKGTEPALASATSTEVPAPAPATAAPTVPVEEAAAVITKDSPIWFAPEAMSSCAKDTKGMVHWNASTFPGVKTVKVALPGKDGAESTFAVSRTVGQKETGPWMRGGMEVILRDFANGSELARAKVPSLPCGDLSKSR